DGCRVDAGAPHERAEPRLRSTRERAEPSKCDRTVLGREWADVGDRGERDEVEVPARNLRVDAEERLPELVEHAGPTELRERILGGAGRADGTVGEPLGRAVVVGDDDVQASFLCLGDLGGGGDPAVDGE